MFDPTKYCTACGTVGPTKRMMHGSIGVEILLYFIALFFWVLFIPAILFSLYRIATAHPGCRKCGSKDVIPLDSPRARQVGAGQMTA
jgi:hypothetical protein